MSLRSAFQNMAAKDCVMIVGSDVSESLTYRRIDTGTTAAINGVITEDGFATPGAMDVGLGNEDRTAVVYFSMADVSTILTGRSPVLPIAGDKITQTIGAISTVWVVKTQPRLDSAGGVHLNLRFDSITGFSGKNMGTK